MQAVLVVLAISSPCSADPGGPRGWQPGVVPHGLSTAQSALHAQGSGQEAADPGWGLHQRQGTPDTGREGGGQENGNTGEDQPRTVPYRAKPEYRKVCGCMAKLLSVYKYAHSL